MVTARLKTWWVRKVDSDSVRGFVPMYNSAWLVAALVLAFVLPPIVTLSEGLGHFGYVAWVWASIWANALPTIGLWMRDGGQPIQDMSARLLKRDWLGLYLQASGHLLSHVLMLIFQAGAWLGAVRYFQANYLYAGMTIFCAIMLVPWTLGTLLLYAQCIRKLQRGRELEEATS